MKTALLFLNLLSGEKSICRFWEENNWLKYLVAMVGFQIILLPLLAQQGGISAREVIETIKMNVGIPWKEPTVDVFKLKN